MRPRGGPSASITITLVNGVTLTLTGSATGTSFTVSDSNGDTCTGTLGNLLAANCTLFGVPTTLTGVVVVASGLVGLTTYCGVESPAGSGYGSGALLIAITSSNAFVGRVATVNDSGSLYVGTVSSASFTTNVGYGAGSTNTLTGAFTSSSASGTENNSGGTVIGNWTATSPCPLLTATATPSTVTFNAVGSQPPPNQIVTVAAVGGTGTLGPIAAVITPTSATWLTATVSGNVITLSASPPAAGSSNQATVEIYAMFATAPDAVKVTYNVTTVPSALWLGTSDGILYEFANPSPAFGTFNKVTSNVTGLGYLAADQQADLWLSSPSAGTLYEKKAAHLGSTGSDLSIKIAGTGLPTNQIQPSGMAFNVSQTLWAVDFNNSGWLYGYSASALAANPVDADPTYKLQVTSVANGGNVTNAQLAAVAFDATGNMWIADAATSVVYKLLPGQLSGSGFNGQASGFMHVGPNASAQPSAIAFDPSGNQWVSFLGTGVPYGFYVYTPAQLGNIQHNSAPSPFAIVEVSGGMTPITSVAFDGAGNLWLVQSNGLSGTVGVVAKVELPTTTGTFGVPASTFGPSGDVPTSIAFVPPPAGVPMYSVLGGGRHASTQSPLAAVRSAPVRRMTR